jgi:hypothetical protein
VRAGPDSPQARRAGAAWTLALAAVTASAAQFARAQDNPDAAAKVAFLVKLAPFVDWPARPSATDPFVICVVGKDPFGAVLDRALVGQSAAGRPIIAKRLARAERDAGCQIMYLGGSPTQTAKDALATVHATPVLTVTAGGRAPGIVDLAPGTEPIRFRIDDKAAAESGLKISSRLLGLAVSVRPRAAPAKP